MSLANSQLYICNRVIMYQGGKSQLVCLNAGHTSLAIKKHNTVLFKMKSVNAIDNKYQQMLIMNNK